MMLENIYKWVRCVTFMLGLWVQQGDAIFVLKCSTQGFFNKNAFQRLGEKLLLLPYFTLSVTIVLHQAIDL